MSAPSRYAVVADEATMAALLGVGRTGLVGACIVDGDMAECHVLERREDLDALVSGIPTCPSGYGSETAFPDFASEAEALSMIADAAAAKAAAEADPSFPPGFAPALPRMAGGLRVRMTGYGLDLAVSGSLAAALGWREGTNVSLGVSSCGRLLAVSRGGKGASLVRDLSDPDFLCLDRDLSGIPLGVDLVETGWLEPEYQADRASLVLAVPSPLAPAPSAPAASEVPQAGAASGRAVPRLPPPRTAFAACAAAAAGFLAAALWL